jgi:hypothetical protein
LAHKGRLLMDAETFDVFDADHFGLDGQILVIYAGGKPRLAYRRSTRDRWSPEIRPATPRTPADGCNCQP